MKARCQKKGVVSKQSEVQKKTVSCTFKALAFPASMKNERNVYTITVGIPKRKRQIGRPRSAWKHSK
jgi:hypothetical protein